MKVYRGSAFTAERAWSGANVARLGPSDVKLRWTDAPFRWHANAGEEIFVLLHGRLDMHVRAGGAESVVELEPGDFLRIAAGEEHVAHPRGAAVVLVIEEPGDE